MPAMKLCCKDLYKNQRKEDGCVNKKLNKVIWGGFCPPLCPWMLGEKGLGVLRWRLWPLREKDLTVMVSESVDVSLALSCSLRWSNKVSCVGGPPCLSIDHNQGPCSFIAVLFSYCPRNLQTPSCARCHKSYILTVFLPLCIFYFFFPNLWVKAIKHAACTLCVHSCHLSRTLLWKGKEKKVKFHFLFPFTNLPLC